MLEICIFSGAFLVTYFGVARLRAWSLKRGVIDHPNDRSSHIDPTPRGGGLVIALAVTLAYVSGSYLIGFDMFPGFVAGALMVLTISWLDDVYTVSFVWRLLIHSIAAAIVIYCCGYVHSLPLSIEGEVLPLGWVGPLLTFCWIVWMTNAYNFMDGIDGIASIQAITAAVGWLIIGLSSDLSAVIILSGSILFVSFGFLLHNWPPARIFMGDAGSAFLGFVFACFPLLAARSSPESRIPWFPVAVALVWLFIFDSVLTFFRRLIRREQVWQAHREHLYQRLVRTGYSHRRVTLLYAGISLVTAGICSFLVVSSNKHPTLWIAISMIFGATTVMFVCWKQKCLIMSSAG